MVFDVSGNTQSSFMITGVESLFAQGYWPLALLVFLSAIALPTVHLILLWYLLGGCSLKRAWPGLSSILSIVELFMPWNLIPVFAVGVMAAVLKLEQLGQIHWKSGALWIGFLALSSLMVTLSFDRSLLEQRIADIDARDTKSS